MVTAVRKVPILCISPLISLEQFFIQTGVDGKCFRFYFQVLLIGLQIVVLWAEIASNQHLSHRVFSLVLKVGAELGELVWNRVKRRKYILF